MDPILHDAGDERNSQKKAGAPTGKENDIYSRRTGRTPDTRIRKSPRHETMAGA